MPLALRVRRAYNEEKQELRVVSTWSDTESRSSMVMPMMFMVLLRVPPAIGGVADKEGLVFCITTISRVLAGFRWRFFWAAQVVIHGQAHRAPTGYYASQ